MSSGQLMLVYDMDRARLFLNVFNPVFPSVTCTSDPSNIPYYLLNTGYRRHCIPDGMTPGITMGPDETLLPSLNDCRRYVIGFLGPGVY